MTTVENDLQRALHRRRQLLDRYGGTLDLLADIFRDDDWRRIDDASTGRPYTAFTRFVERELKVSAAYARRTAQTIRELVLPLRERAGAEAASTVTLTDMENLGTEGARRLIASLDQPAVTGAVVQETIRERIATIATSKATAPGGQEDGADGVGGRLSMTAAAVPAARTSSVVGVAAGGAPPWAEAASVPRPAAKVDEARPGKLDRPESGLDAALTEILTADPASAAGELVGREADIARAAVALTRIRAQLLAAAVGV